MFNSSRIRRGLCATLSAACLGVGGAAMAATDQPPTLTVRYSDLDLSSTRDTHILYHRLKVAAVEVCDRYADTDLGTYLRWQRCYSDALQRAVAQVRSPELLALYQSDRSHSGQRG